MLTIRLFFLAQGRWQFEGKTLRLLHDACSFRNYSDFPPQSTIIEPDIGVLERLDSGGSKVSISSWALCLETQPSFIG